MNKTLLLSFLLLSFIGVSQDIPKLWDDFREGSSSARVKACDELADYYRSEAQDTLKVLGEDLFLFGIDHHYYPAIEQGKLTLAEYLIRSGKTSDGIAMAKALIPNIEERGDDRMLSKAATLIGLGYIAQRDSKSAYHWSYKATRYGAENPDPIVRAQALNALAESYYLKNQPEKAIKTYKEFISRIKPYKKYRSVCDAYGRLGDIYRQEGNIHMAGKFFRYSMKYARKLKTLTTPMGHAMNNMAILYFEEGDTVKAREYFVKALNLRLKARDVKAISESYYNLGDYHFYIEQNEKALYWYKKSLDYAAANNLKSEQIDALRALAAVAREDGDFKGGMAYLEEFADIQQEILVQNSSDDDEVSELQQTIIRLEAENRIGNSGAGSGEDGFFSSLRWEWFVIGLLVVMLIFVLRNRKMMLPDN